MTGGDRKRCQLLTTSIEQVYFLVRALIFRGNGYNRRSRVERFSLTATHFLKAFELRTVKSYINQNAGLIQNIHAGISTLSPCTRRWHDKTDEC